MSTRLNLACGSKAKKGWINLDLVKQDGVDVVHDLDVFPWPFDDSSMTEIEAWDIFEHVDHPCEFMVECHRVLRPGRYLHIHTSYFLNPESFTDPTHKRFCTPNTFDYWVEGTFLQQNYGVAYGNVLYEMVDLHIDKTNYLDVTMRKISGGSGK